MLTKEQKAKLKSLQDRYYKVKMWHDAKKMTSEANELKVLSDNKFFDEDGNRILKYSWKIADENEFRRFLDLLFEANKKSGIPVTNPELVAEYKEKQELQELEKRLLEFQLTITPKNIVEDIKRAHRHWKYREECLDLILRLAV
jgi:hypothetical protein